MEVGFYGQTVGKVTLCLLLEAFLCHRGKETLPVLFGKDMLSHKTALMWLPQKTAASS